MLRSLAVAAALVAGSVAVRAADENPLKGASKGDAATYTVSVRIGNKTIDGVLTQTVVEKSDKEATVAVTGNLIVGGKDVPLPKQEEKFDLDKPLDPVKGAATLPGGGEATATKVGKAEKDKIKVQGKEYDATLTTYDVVLKMMGQDIKGKMKVWTVTKDVPTGTVKMEITAEFNSQPIAMTLELKELKVEKK